MTRAQLRQLKTALLSKLRDLPDDHRGLTANSLSSATGFSLASCHEALEALEREGDAGRYELSSRVLWVACREQAGVLTSVETPAAALPARFQELQRDAQLHRAFELIHRAGYLYEVHEALSYIIASGGAMNTVRLTHLREVLRTLPDTTSRETQRLAGGEEFPQNIIAAERSVRWRRRP